MERSECVAWAVMGAGILAWTVTKRPYRDPLDPEDALAELKHNAGSQFDADVVAAFVAVHATAGHAGRATV